MVLINVLILIKVGLLFSEVVFWIFLILIYKIQNYIIRVNLIFFCLCEYDIDYFGYQKEYFVLIKLIYICLYWFLREYFVLE